MAKHNACFGADGGLINGVAMTGLSAKSSTFSKQGSPMIEHNFGAALNGTLKLFRDYLRHLGMVTMAAVVAILACSLKGIITMQMNTNCNNYTEI